MDVKEDTESGEESKTRKKRNKREKENERLVYVLALDAKIGHRL